MPKLNYKEDLAKVSVYNLIHYLNDYYKNVKADENILPAQKTREFNMVKLHIEDILDSYEVITGNFYPYDEEEYENIIKYYSVFRDQKG